MKHEVAVAEAAKEHCSTEQVAQVDELLLAGRETRSDVHLQQIQDSDCQRKRKSSRAYYPLLSEE